MGIMDKIRAWLGGAPPADSPSQEQESEQLYDRIRIVKPDGTMIEGRDAVKAHFDEEQRLLDEHGSTITFQVYRINLGAKTIDELQGDKLAEIKVDGDFVSGTDTVTDVEKKLRSLVAEASRSGREADVAGALRIRENERISFSFNGRRMMPDKLFYADHFMLLPVWVHALLHDCDIDELMEVAGKLRGNP